VWLWLPLRVRVLRMLVKLASDEALEGMESPLHSLFHRHSGLSLPRIFSLVNEGV
jgi:hypothetical protein